MPDKKAPKVLTYQQAYDLALQAGSRFPSVVAAQFALETDWGRKTANAKNNLFNIKWNDGAAKRLQERGIKVTKAAKSAKDNMTGSVDHYMQFESIEDAFYGYQNFIETNPRYSKALEAATAQEYLEGIKAAGYAEDPKYIQSIGKIANGAGYDLNKETRFDDESIAEIRGKGVPGIENTIKDAEQKKDGIQSRRTFDTSRNRSTIMRNVDWSQSTINERQFDRMERFVGDNIGGNNTAPAKDAEEVVAKSAIAKQDINQLEQEEVPVEVQNEDYTPTGIPDIPEVPQVQQYEGGVQPNGRKSNFTRTEDLQAQGNTYNPLNLF